MAQMDIQRIALEQISEAFSATVELSSVALGGRVTSVSDEFFAEAFHLLLVEPAPSLKGQFGPKGALFSGWETRRHNPDYDWCIIKLGTSGRILGFDIDTANFNGNEAPQANVEVLHDTMSLEEPQVHDKRWTEILPKVDLGPNSRHLFKVPLSSAVNYVKLNMFPDGGIARFRVYGFVEPVFPADINENFDLAHVFAGGHVEATSDQHFGLGSNLLLPGRGKDMGDGWETKRSRQKGHTDWVIIKLGTPGLLEYVEIDTAHFKGNFPESCELHATTSQEGLKDGGVGLRWRTVLPRTKLGPHRRHFFQLENVSGHAYTHVLCTIYPDGGIKRIRIFGRRAAGLKVPEGAVATGITDTNGLVNEAQLESPVVSGGLLVGNADHRPSGVTQDSTSPTSIKPVSSKTILALPLTPEAFAPFGRVIQGYDDLHAVPRGTKVTSANQGTATKFHKLSLLNASYPPESIATAGLSVYRCNPVPLESNGTVKVKMLERHPYTNQAFIPMAGATKAGERNPGNFYVVVVALNEADDKPDLSTLRAFIATGSQGILYDTAVWHMPMTVLEKIMDLTCVETQIGDGSSADCQIVEIDEDIILKVELWRFQTE